MFVINHLKHSMLIGHLHVDFILFPNFINCAGDAGKLVDSYISGKVTQLKEQIATLEKREER